MIAILLTTATEQPGEETTYEGVRIITLDEFLDLHGDDLYDEDDDL